MLRAILKRSEPRHGATLLLGLEVLYLIIQTLLILAIAGTIFVLYSWLSQASTLELQGEIANGKLIGQIKPQSPITGLAGSFVAFFLAFVAGAVFVGPLLSTLSKLRHLHTYVYQSLGLRIPNIVDKNCVPAQVDTVRRQWALVRQQVLEQKSFLALSNFIGTLGQHLR